MSKGRFSMAEPMCLIENGKDGKLRVSPQALEILLQIEQHVVVVAVVGLYRTGKSYLMNQLAGKKNGFALGATIQSKTKGIWMWCVPHPMKKDHTLVLLDTEGLGDVEKGDERNDSWIFSLAVLLSSTLVYNSMGTIDNTALQRLHYVTELTERIKVKSCGGGGDDDDDDDDSVEFARVFPSFVWTVRDFTLVLEYNGQPITADEYLDKALILKHGHSRDVQMYNMPRSCLRNYFPTRKCFVFDRPTTPNKMKCLGELTDADLELSFVNQAKEFSEYIFRNAETKMLKGGIVVTGRLLGNLAKAYVDTICSNQIPCLENAVLALSQIENTNAVSRAVTHYKAQMAERVSYPTETQDELSQIHGSVEKEAVKIFINSSFKDEDQKHQLKLMENLQKEYDAICARNVQESKRVCESIIKQVFQPLEDLLSSGFYMSSGGYKKYCVDIQKYTSHYRSTPGKGVKAEESLKEYLNGKKSVGDAILTADMSLTEAEQQMEAERAKRQAIEQEAQAAKEHAEMCERKLKDQEQTFKENMEQLMRKFEEDSANAAKEHERLLAARLKEQQDLLNQGFKNSADLLQSQIDDLRREKESIEKSAKSPSIFSSFLSTIGQCSIFLPGVVPKLAGAGCMLLSRFV